MGEALQNRASKGKCYFGVFHFLFVSGWRKWYHSSSRIHSVLSSAYPCHEGWKGRKAGWIASTSALMTSSLEGEEWFWGCGAGVPVVGAPHCCHRPMVTTAGVPGTLHEKTTLCPGDTFQMGNTPCMLLLWLSHQGFSINSCLQRFTGPECFQCITP